MSFVVNRKQLADELSLLQTVAEKKGTIPILSTVLMRFEGISLKLIASDGDVYMFTSVEAEGAAWAACVPLAQFSSFARLCGAEYLTLNQKGGGAELKCGTSVCSLPVVDAGQFPDYPLAFDGLKAIVSGDGLRTALARCLPCVSMGESRWALQGVKFESREGKIKIIATDRCRLAVGELPAKGDIDVLVPERALRALLRTDSETVEIQHDDSRVSLRCGHRTVITRLLANQFPNWEMILPKSLPCKVEIETKKFSEALKRTSITRSETYKGGVGRILGSVIMNFERSQIVIDTGVSDRGRSEELVSVQSNLNGDTISVGVNPDFIMDFLRYAGERVTCELKDGNNVLQFSDGSGLRYLVMPVRI